MSDLTHDGLLVEADRLIPHLRRPDLVVIDCSVRIEDDGDGGERIIAARGGFEAGHLPGARFADLPGRLSDPNGRYPFTMPDGPTFERGVRALGIDAGDTVVVYSTGNPWWATRLWWQFRIFGLDRVLLLDGGWKTWSALGLPIETGAAAEPAEGDIRVGDRRPWLVAAEELTPPRPDRIVVDALSADRFRGDTIVHGGRRGHIPGSINLPAHSLLDPADGRLLPKAIVADRLAEKGLLDPHREVVTYCGGGISATFLLFALAWAGGRDGRLYDASRYEWGHRDDLPIEVSP